MKKLFLILLLIILPISFVVCSSVNIKDKITINKENSNLSMVGMGTDYNISPLDRSKYGIQIYAKEYNYGELKEKHNLLKTSIKLENNINDLHIGVFQNDKNISVGLDGSYLDFPVNFFNKSDNGTALSVLDIEKEIELNKEIPIAIYSIGKKDESTYAMNIDGNDDLGLNENDLIIYLKINKVGDM